MSWNRANVVLTGIVVLGLLCLPGVAAWAQEEMTEAAEVMTDEPTEIDHAADVAVESAVEGAAEDAAAGAVELGEAAAVAEVVATEASDVLPVDEIEDVDTGDQADLLDDVDEIEEIEDVEDVVIDTAESDDEFMDESDSMFENESVYYDYVGWYVRGGVFGGFIEGRKGVDFDPGVGFSIAGGLRHNRWMAVEANYSHVLESKTDDIGGGKNKSVEEYEVAVDLHFYPLGLIEVSAISDRLQPYLSGGFGYSEVDVTSRKQTRYLMRIGGGLDLFATEKMGVYFDGSYSIITGTTKGNDFTLLSGRGAIGCGVFARF